MIQIVEYESRYREAFKALNYAWISKLFEVESSDQAVLEDPEGEILNKGGAIFIALYEERPVGTCALLAKRENAFELAKMAVDESYRGKSIGFKLGQAAVQRARELGCGQLFLETNAKLTPAIKLYEKLGFRHICGKPSPYSRCDVQMELLLS